jgi:hypothetical protein
MPEASAEAIRRVLIETVSEYAANSGMNYDGPTTLQEVAKRLQIEQRSKEAEVLVVAFNDLFRIGYLAWGRSDLHTGPPHYMVTEAGRAALAIAGRSPFNPPGYLAYLDVVAPGMSPVAISYVQEALETFRCQNFRATSVMIGAASEDVVLSIRNDLITRMRSLSHTIHGDLQARQIATVLRQITRHFDGKTGLMPSALEESYKLYWQNFSNYIRQVRNDAGHPALLNALTEPNAHAALYMFPELAGLAEKLSGWILSAYS